MEIAKNLMIILLTGILTENFVLSKFLGICPFLGVSKKLDSSIGMGAAVTFVMVCASLVTYPIYYGILVPLGIEYMNTIAFILVIAVFVQLVEMVLKKYMPPLYKSLGVYLPLITTNCAVLGVTLLNLTKDYDLLESVVNSFGAGLGFMIAMIIFSGVRSRLERCDIPKALQGAPITLMAASIVSLAFIGFGVDIAAEEFLLIEEYNELLQILGLFSDVRPTDGTDVLVILQPDGSCTVTDGDKLRIDCAPNSNEGVLSMLTGMAPSHITLFDFSNGACDKLCRAICLLFGTHVEKD